MILGIRIQGWKKYQQMGGALPRDPEPVFGAGRYHHGMVGPHSPGFPVHADLKRALQDNYQFVDIVRVKRRACSRLRSVNAESAGHSLFVTGHVPLTVTGPPGYFRGPGMVNNWHLTSPRADPANGTYGAGLIVPHCTANQEAKS